MVDTKGGLCLADLRPRRSFLRRRRRWRVQGTGFLAIEPAAAALWRSTFSLWGAVRHQDETGRGPRFAVSLTESLSRARRAEAGAAVAVAFIHRRSRTSESLVDDPIRLPDAVGPRRGLALRVGRTRSPDPFEAAVLEA